MTSDNQFTALGPTLVGFQTNGSRIDRGVYAYGRYIGVEAQGPVGVHAEGKDEGVHASGVTAVRAEGKDEGVHASGVTAVDAEGKDEGVHASGVTAVDAKGSDLGVKAEGDAKGVDATGGRVGVEGSGHFGVAGHGDNSEEAIGVYGDAARIGVAGLGKSWGGAFGTTTKAPQLYLQPHKIEDRGAHPAAPQERYPPDDLPHNGLAGDIYATTMGESGQVELWLCVQAQEGMRGAFWAQILKGAAVEGTRTPEQDQG